MKTDTAKQMDRTTITHEGITYTYKAEHGSWHSDPENEAVGSLCMPANADGSPALDEVGEIDFSYFEGGGMCEARCALCVAEEAKWVAAGWGPLLDAS